MPGYLRINKNLYKLKRFIKHNKTLTTKLKNLRFGQTAALMMRKTFMIKMIKLTKVFIKKFKLYKILKNLLFQTFITIIDLNTIKFHLLTKTRLKNIKIKKDWLLQILNM